MTREKRSAVEREFIVIGEAVSMLAKFWPDRFRRLSDGRKVIGFRNILTHNYASVDHETVYETAVPTPCDSILPPLSPAPYLSSVSVPPLGSAASYAVGSSQRSNRWQGTDVSNQLPHELNAFLRSDSALMAKAIPRHANADDTRLTRRGVWVRRRRDGPRPQFGPAL